MPTAKHCIAVAAARKLGLIHADLAVALSLIHKAITFARMPDVDYDALTLASTGALPSGCPEPSGQTVPATSNNPASPPAPNPPPPGVKPVTRNRVQRRRHGDRADHHGDPPTN